MIANERYNAKYLALVNKAASAAAKEPTWCNASWLVKIDKEKGAPGKFLRCSELKLVEKKEKDGAKIVIPWALTRRPSKSACSLSPRQMAVLRMDYLRLRAAQ